MLLSKDHPQVILYRSSQPVLPPLLPQDRFDIYYGMADNRIGVARLDLPEHLP
jgi:predicted GH43/DUF377 family glycosyl hydrolase